MEEKYFVVDQTLSFLNEFSVNCILVDIQTTAKGL